MRVLYLCHVDWAWIRQRPQFLAEGLRSRGVETDVRYLPAWRRQVRAGVGAVHAARRLPHLPPVAGFIRWFLNPLLRRVWLTATARPPDFVWLTHPVMYSSVPRRWRNRIVYDAMDIVTAFEGADRRVASLEQATVSSAAVIFASSPGVAAHIASYPQAPEALIVRNALDASKPWKLASDSYRPDGPVTYCGTVSAWFDIEALSALRREQPDLPVRLIGPVERRLVSQFTQIGVELTGPMEHGAMLRAMHEASVLIMPFRITELIEAVDPVKLYEYIATGIPTVSIWYSGLQPFAPYVDFYRVASEFPAAIRLALSRGLRGESTGQFCHQNSWDSRVTDILRHLPTPMIGNRR